MLAVFQFCIFFILSIYNNTMDKLKGLAATAAAAKTLPEASPTSNADIAANKRIAENRGRKVGQQLLKEYCIELNKQMEKNIPAIIDKMEITAQSENFKAIANEFFDTKLNDTYKTALEQQIKTNIKQELRPILYDHFKADLKEDENMQMSGGTLQDIAGKMVAAAGAGESGVDLQGLLGNETDAAGAGERGDNNTQESASASSLNGADSAMANQIVSTINKNIMNDETLIEELKKGIITNITSGSFKTGLQNKVFEILVPEINIIMKEKITEILNNNDFKSAAMEVVKGQQELYNKRNPTNGGKKHSIKKTKKTNNKRTRRH
jgi:hypothetical protein